MTCGSCQLCKDGDSNRSRACAGFKASYDVVRYTISPSLPSFAIIAIWIGLAVRLVVALSDLAVPPGIFADNDSN